MRLVGPSFGAARHLLPASGAHGEKGKWFFLGRYQGRQQTGFPAGPLWASVFRAVGALGFGQPSPAGAPGVLDPRIGEEVHG